MSQRLMCDVDMVEEQQLRQLEGDAAGGPPTLPESMAVPLTPGGASSARMYNGSSTSFLFFNGGASSMQTTATRSARPSALLVVCLLSSSFSLIAIALLSARPRPPLPEGWLYKGDRSYFVTPARYTHLECIDACHRLSDQTDGEPGALACIASAAAGKGTRSPGTGGTALGCTQRRKPDAARSAVAVSRAAGSASGVATSLALIVTRPRVTHSNCPSPSAGVSPNGRNVA